MLTIQKTHIPYIDIESIVFLRLILIRITTLNFVAVAVCLKSQCTQEIGVFHCWLRIFYLLVNGLDLVSEDGAEGVMGGAVQCGGGSLAGDELGTDDSMTFLVVGVIWG